ncbi:hypothetical protein B4U80_14534, partial [Leptotrombidium deliense]
SYVAIRGDDTNIAVIDRKLNQPVARLPNSQNVNCIALKPKNEEMMVTVGNDNVISVWCSRDKKKRDTQYLSQFAYA